MMLPTAHHLPDSGRRNINPESNTGLTGPIVSTNAGIPDIANVVNKAAEAVAQIIGVINLLFF
jgi:hypothetical protein